MQKSPQQLAQDVELFLDQQSADVTVLKVMLQVLVWNLIRRDPKAHEALGHLKNEVMASLYLTMSPPSAGQGNKAAEHLRQLTLIRANRMFRDIENVVSVGNRDDENMDSKIMGAKSMTDNKQSQASGSGAN